MERRAAKKTAKKTAKKATKKAAASSAPARRPVAKKQAKPAAKKKVAKKAATKVAKTTSSVPVVAKLPWVWKYETGTQCVGLWVDEMVWASNSAGDVYAFDRDGEVHKRLKLPDESVAAVADEAWKYAGCADGKVYDLTGRVPRAIYDVGGANIGWLEVHRGNLALSDLDGAVAVYDAEGDLKWKKSVKGGGEGWVCRTDSTGIYHGSEVGLRKMSWEGKLLWENKEVGDVRFCVINGDDLVMTAGYQKRRRADLFILNKTTGKLRLKIPVDSKIKGFSNNGAEGCAAQEATTTVGERFYVGVGGVLHVYNGEGTKLWEADLTERKGNGVCNMSLVDGALYVSMFNGDVRWLDISDEAIDKALAGAAINTRTVKRVAEVEDDGAVEVVADAGDGVVVECVKVGGKLKVRPISAGYKKDWYCQFPRDLRIEGARFVVDKLLEASNGGFYRALGDIKRLKD